MADKNKTRKSVNEAAPHINKKVNKDKTGTASENCGCSSSTKEQTTVELITLNNFTRDIAAGAEFYSDHAKKVTKEFIGAAKGQKSSFVIKDKWKLLLVATELGIKTGGRSKNEIAAEVGELILNEFSKREGALLFLKRAPLKRQEVWRKLDIAPSGIDHEIAAIKKLTNADGDQKKLLRGARCSLANGWASNMIAVELQDIIFGTPSPVLENIGKSEMITGFSPEAIIYSLGGSFRGSLHPLIDNIINGRIRGIAGIFNCDNDLRTNSDAQVTLVKELINNDVLILFTGDGVLPLAKAGLMVAEGAKYAGEGLRSVCEAVGLPPVLHMGISIDNCRILITASAIVQEAKLGDISDLPACIVSPDGINEKAVAIGQCFVSSGFYTISRGLYPTDETANSLSGDMEKMYGGMWDFETDPLKMAHKMIAHIDKKRKALGIDKARERVLFDMSMRRELI